MILNLIKFVLVMDPDIHGVNKINKLFLSNYSLTFQLFLINLLASFIGFISLIIINIYLINNDRNISIDYDNGLNQINKITNFLGNNSILRVPLFNENCENFNNQECEILISEPELDPTSTQQFIFQNFFQNQIDVKVYNYDWIKFADTNDMYISSEVDKIDIDDLPENSLSFIDEYRLFYINFFNKVRNYFIKNKYLKQSNKLGSEINIVSETIKNRDLIKKKFYNSDNDIFQIISSPIIHNNKVFGVVIVSYPLLSNNYNLGLNSFNLFNFYIFLVLIVLLISFFFSQSLVSPIKTLSKLTLLERTKIKINNPTPYPIRGDEIGVLSKEIQNMSLDLKSQINQLEKFAADVSHELKNPLTGLQSASELIVNDNIIAKDKKLLMENMSYDIERMNRLISDITNFTKIKTEIETENFEYIDIEKLIKNIVKDYDDNKKNIQFHIENLMESNNKKINFVLANKDKLSQVLYNLIDNSISILENDQKILLQLSIKDNETVRIKVYDQGKGIPLTQAEKVFERFYTDRGINNGYHSGLGLSISREIIKSFQGAIKIIKSDKGNYSGACFIINLPLKVDQTKN